MIETNRLKLSLIEEQDALEIVRWRNDPQIIKYFFNFTGITVKEHQEWYQQYIKNNNRIEFMISITQQNKKIGTIGFSNIDYKNQKAEYGVMIGDKASQSNGYAKEASIGLINYGFKEMNLQKIYLKVLRNNERAIHLYNKLQFKKEGILRKEIFKNGDFQDVVMMSILRDEWKM